MNNVPKILKEILIAIRDASCCLRDTMTGGGDPLVVTIANPTDITGAIVAAIEAQEATLTAKLQEICDALDMGIDVNATQAGTWSVTVDGQPLSSALTPANIQDVVAAIQAADLNVNIAGQDADVNVNITNDPFEVVVDFQELTDFLETIVRVDYESTKFCIVDVNGDKIPLTGVFTEVRYDFEGNRLSGTLVYSQIVNNAWTTYTLQAGDEVVECEGDDELQVRDLNAVRTKECFSRLSSLVDNTATDEAFSAAGFPETAVANPFTVFPNDRGTVECIEINIENPTGSEIPFNLTVQQFGQPAEVISPVPPEVNFTNGVLTPGTYVYKFTLANPLVNPNEVTITGDGPGGFYNVNLDSNGLQIDSIGVVNGENIHPIIRLLTGGEDKFCRLTTFGGEVTITDGTGAEIPELPANVDPSECEATSTEELSIPTECKQELADKIGEVLNKCDTATFEEKVFVEDGQLIRHNYNANAAETLPNVNATPELISAFFDDYDYTAVADLITPSPDIQLPDFVGGAGTESNVTYLEGYVKVDVVTEIRFQNTNNWAARAEIGVNCGEYEDILTAYNGPGFTATSPAGVIPVGIHRIRITSWDYDGANGNINVQTNVDGGGFSTGNDGLLLSSIKPTSRCFLGRVCEGSEEITEIATGLVVQNAQLQCGGDEQSSELSISTECKQDLANLIAEASASTPETETYDGVLLAAGEVFTVPENTVSLTVTAQSGSFDVSFDGGVSQALTARVGSRSWGQGTIEKSSNSGQLVITSNGDVDIIFET